MTPTRVKPPSRQHPDWLKPFLAVYAETGNVKMAVTAAGVSRQMAYKYRAENPDFAQAWAEAEADAVDALRAEARKRALDSDSGLLMFLLKAHDPMFRERSSVEITGAGGGPVEIAAIPVDPARLREVLRTLDAALPEPDGDEVTPALNGHVNGVAHG